MISDPEARELLERAGESLELRNKVKADMKTFVLSKVTCLHENACVRPTSGQATASRWQNMKKNSTVRQPYDDFTLIHYLERTKDKRHNILTDPLRFFLRFVLLLLAMVENSWMGSADQFATFRCLTSYKVTPHDCIDGSNNESSCSSLVTTTVTFLTQPIQMSSRLLGNDNHWTQPSHSTTRTTCNLLMTR